MNIQEEIKFNKDKLTALDKKSQTYKNKIIILETLLDKYPDLTIFSDRNGRPNSVYTSKSAIEKANLIKSNGRIPYLNFGIYFRESIKLENKTYYIPIYIPTRWIEITETQNKYNTFFSYQKLLKFNKNIIEDLSKFNPKIISSFKKEMVKFLSTRNNLSCFDIKSIPKKYQLY